jgi:uncharacterized repeat protein (TIGR01451 family)
MNHAELRAPRRRGGRVLLIATSMLALVSGLLTVAVVPVATVQAVTPGTTTFNDINPDNGPGLPLAECPDPCASQHNGGRVNGLAVSPGLPEGLAPDTYYAASEVGGLFKSTDGGGHWVHLDSHVPHLTWDVETEIGGLRVYATSFFDGRAEPLTGVQISSNGGQTWTRASLPDPAGCAAAIVNQPSAFGIALRPGTVGEVLVGTNCGLARSLDHGDTWVRFDPTTTGAPNSIWDVVALPGGRTYACGDDGLLLSMSGAPGMWSRLGKPNPAFGGYCSLAVDPDDPTVVFMASGTAYFADIVVALGDADFFEGRITEPSVCPGGAAPPCPTVAWTVFPYPDDDPATTDKIDKKIRVPIVATNDRSAGFDPADASDGFDLWIGDGSLWRIPCHAGQTPRCKTDKTKWSGSFTDHLGGAQMAHGDSGDLVFDPHDSVDACPTIYSSDGGVYANALLTNDACQTPDFRGANEGLHAYYLHGMAGFSPTGGNEAVDEDLYFATQDVGLFYTDNAGGQTPTWFHGVGGDALDVTGDAQRTVNTVPGNTGTILQVGLRGYTNMTSPVVGIPVQPNWDSEALVRADTGRYLLALPAASGTVPRGIRDIDITQLGSAPLGTEFAGASWPAAADPPCHVVLAAGSPDPVPYVLAGRCWYGTQNVGGAAIGPADKLYTIDNEQWVERDPPPAPDGSVDADAGFGIVAVDPMNPLRLYAAVLFDGPASRMMRSTDGGRTWVTDAALTRLMYRGFEPDLNDPGDGVRVMPQASLVAFDPSDPDIIVAGGRSSGVFITSNGGQSWALLTDPFTPGSSGIPHLPNPAFARFDHDRPGVVRIYLGTGRGVWRIDLANADLSVTKADAPDPVILGTDLTYTIAVSNAGPDMAQNGTLEDELPAGTTFSSLSAPAGWSCEHPAFGARGTVRCMNASMAPGTATFTLVVRTGAVNPAVGVRNTARVYSAAIDPNPANNAANAITAVIVPVRINIQPGSVPNPINLRGQATVAVLTTAAGEYGLPLAFDATTIALSSVRFGSASAVLAGNGALAKKDAHPEDAYELDETTKDGDIDLVLHFRVADSGLTTLSTQGCVAGTFGPGYRFFGCDSVVVKP